MRERREFNFKGNRIGVYADLRDRGVSNMVAVREIAPLLGTALPNSLAQRYCLNPVKLGIGDIAEFKGSKALMVTFADLYRILSGVRNPLGRSIQTWFVQEVTPTLEALEGMTKPDVEVIEEVNVDIDTTNLVVTTDNGLTTTTLQISKVFGKRHDNVIRDLEKLACSESFNALNFEAVTYEDRKGEKRPMYNVTKDGWAFLVMGFNGEKAGKFKEQYITAFNAMEQELIKQQMPKPMNDVELFELAAANARKVLMLEEKVSVDAPKVAFATAVTGTVDSIQFGQFAKFLRSTGTRIGRNKLFAWMRDEDFINKDNVPYQQYLDLGVLEIKETHWEGNSGTHVGCTPYITGKGQAYFQKKLEGYGE
ncbi:MAG: hypothetical protein GY799_21325 [Desulfobulbaceae bacterium]|nr:hypothetical protein [Desulfobulbaceae bacterium]